MRRVLPFVGLMMTIAAPAAAQPAAARPVDWNALRDEAVQILAEYIRINTTNPPGNEKAGAEYLARILQREPGGALPLPGRARSVPSLLRAFHRGILWSRPYC